MANTWTRMKKTFVDPYTYEAQAEKFQQRSGPAPAARADVSVDMPQVVDSPDLARRQAEIAEKYRLIEEERLKKMAPVDEPQGYQQYPVRPRR